MSICDILIWLSVVLGFCGWQTFRFTKCVLSRVHSGVLLTRICSCKVVAYPTASFLGLSGTANGDCSKQTESSIVAQPTPPPDYAMLSERPKKAANQYQLCVASNVRDQEHALLRQEINFLQRQLADKQDKIRAAMMEIEHRVISVAKSERRHEEDMLRS